MPATSLRRRFGWYLGALACSAVVAAAWWSRDPAPTATAPKGTHGAHTDPAAAAPLAAQAEAPSVPTPLDATGAIARVDAVLQHGSLRGTALDGDWGRWVGGTLQPGLSLRRRFDHLLTAQGELHLDELRTWIASAVSAQHGAAGAPQVLAVWDAYLALLRTADVARFDPDDPVSVQAALAQRSAQRQAALGPAWAYAFYSEEEQATAAFIARRAAARAGAASDASALGDTSGNDATALLSAPPASLDDTQARDHEARRISAFGTDGAARLAAENAAWADWESRLDAARLSLQAIANDPQLSAPQRQQAQQAELARRFEGTERLRAQALILPTP